jgi:hypothetical protein
MEKAVLSLTIIQLFWNYYSNHNGHFSVTEHVTCDCQGLLLSKTSQCTLSLYEQLPQAEEVKYLGLHLDRRLTWHKHIFAKRKHLVITLSKMYWLPGRRSKLSIGKKLLVYKVILKPIWTYVIQLWGSASISNIEILERFQGKVLRMISDAPWYVPNTVLRVRSSNHIS